MTNIHISFADNHANIPDINKMLLGNREIKQNMRPHKDRAPCIVIKPFHSICLGENSHTLHLSDEIYRFNNPEKRVLPIPLLGIIAQAGDMFLCETYEFIEVYKYHPIITPTTVAKLHGLTVKETGGLKTGAGFASVKLIITADRLTSFRPGLPIAQLYFLKKIPQK